MYTVDTIDNGGDMWYDGIVHLTGKNMYKNVLLTQNEISLIRKIIGEYLERNPPKTNMAETKNLHIIDRTLMGKKPHN